MTFKKFIKNEDAVSITVGFILTLSITVLVFSAIILSFYSLTQQSEKITLKESFDILGSGMALKITTMDTLVNITQSYGGAVNSLEYEFTIPASIANEGYGININNKQIILESDNEVKAWVPLNTSTRIEERQIFSNAQDYEIVYNNTGNSIKIVEQ